MGTREIFVLKSHTYSATNLVATQFCDKPQQMFEFKQFGAV
jgi:hypothetical protein